MQLITERERGGRAGSEPERGTTQSGRPTETPQARRAGETSGVVGKAEAGGEGEGGAMGREDRCGQQETKGGTTTTSERPPPSSDKRERGPSNPPRCFSHVPFVVESQPSFATTISRISSPASQSWSQPSTSHADLANIPRKDASAFLDRAASSASICFFSALTDPSAGSSVSRIAYAFLTSPGGGGGDGVPVSPEDGDGQDRQCNLTSGVESRCLPEARLDVPLVLFQRLVAALDGSRPRLFFDWGRRRGGRRRRRSTRRSTLTGATRGTNGGLRPC